MQGQPPLDNKRFQKTIPFAKKILYSIIPLVLSSVVLLGLSNYLAAKRQIISGVNREVDTLARQAASTLSTFFALRNDDARTLAATSLLRDYLKCKTYDLKEEAELYRKELAQYFSQFSVEKGVYSRIALWDLKGREVAAGSPSGNPAAEAAVRLPRLKADIAPGEILNTGIHPGRDQAISYYVGAYDDQGRLAGHIVLTCDLRNARSILDQIAAGVHGRALLMSAQDRALLSGRSVASSSVASEAAIAGTPWKVELMTNLAEFLAPLRNIQRLAFLAFVIISILLCSWIIRWTGFITRPIEAMAKGTRRVAQGDLDFHFDAPPVMELRTLADSFNNMTRSLKDRNRELEARIHQLTALLEMEGAVIQRRDEETILNICLKAVAKGLSFDRAGLYWVDAARHEIAGRLIYDREANGPFEEAFKRRRVPMSREDVLNEILRTRMSLLVKDPSAEPRLNAEYVKESGTREFVMAPICGKESVFGIIAADNCYSARPLTESDKDGLTLFAHTIGLALENAGLVLNLAESEARYRAVLENSPVAILGINGQHCITTWNHGAANIFGYTPAEALGKPVRFLFPAPPAVEFTSLMNQVMEHGFVRNHPITGLTKEGRRLDLSLSWGGTLPDFWLNKEWTIVIHDVTESKKLHQQLIQSEKLSAVGQLISGIAHELNNPLQAVVGYAQLLRKEPKMKFQDDIKQIYESAVRCRKIIDNLLLFVRQGKITMRPVSVSQVVQASLDLLEYKLKKKASIQIQLHLDKSVPKVKADFQQLQQVLVNLINNACDAMSSWQGPKNLDIRTASAGSRVRIEVRDTGPGIPEEHRGRIFEAFYSTKPEGRGTGLGLAICQQIMREHGGDIGFETETGRGTTFWLDLPAAGGEEAPAKDGSAAPVPGVRRKTILIVDDERAVLGFVKKVLGSDGHDVRTASSRSAAAKLTARTPFDLVVADIELGDGTGVDLYERWDENSSLPRPDFLFITGDALNGQLQQALKDRGLAFLYKPMDVDDLKRAAYGLLSKKTPSQ